MGGGGGPLLCSVKHLHLMAEPFSRRRGDPISRTRRCLETNKNLLGVTISFLSLVRFDVLMQTFNTDNIHSLRGMRSSLLCSVTVPTLKGRSRLLSKMRPRCLAAIGGRDAQTGR
jgi:hypothetical protein